MSGELTELCGELLKGLKEHKEETGKDPWPAVVDEKDVRKVEGKGESLDELLDSFDDMIDELMGDTRGAERELNPTRTAKDDETLESLVVQAMKQLREVGLPQQAKPSTQAQVQELAISPEDLDQLDALGDLFTMPKPAAPNRRGDMFRPARCLATKARPLIVRTDSEQQVPNLVAGLKSAGTLVELAEHGTTEKDVIEACRDASLIVHCYTPITRKVMEAAAGLRGIVKYGVGIDAIDMVAARELGIPVANVPEYGEGTVAEGAFTLMMCLLKKVKPIQRQMESTGWTWPGEDTLGNDLCGKTVALLGYGRIGRKMARMCRGFDAKVVSYDPHVGREVMEGEGVVKVDSVEELVAMADVLSVHTVLNDDTRGIISKQRIAMMKPTSVVINVSRGAIIDEQALVDALLGGHVGGAGLDVFSKEPVSRGCGHLFEPLLDHPAAILTPHLAFWTSEARSRLEAEAMERSKEILTGQLLTVLSSDPRLRSQTKGVSFGGYSVASGRMVPP